MHELTLSQKIALGIGAIALLRKHAALIPQLREAITDAVMLWHAIVPTDPVIVKRPPIEDVITPHMTNDEQKQFARASRADFG